MSALGDSIVVRNQRENSQTSKKMERTSFLPLGVDIMVTTRHHRMTAEARGNFHIEFMTTGRDTSVYVSGYRGQHLVRFVCDAM